MKPREFWVALNKDGKPVHVTDSKDIADAYDHAYPFTKIVVREVLPGIPDEKKDTWNARELQEMLDRMMSKLESVSALDTHAFIYHNIFPLLQKIIDKLESK